jgi:hypothetical protein
MLIATNKLHIIPFLSAAMVPTYTFLNLLAHKTHLPLLSQALFQATVSTVTYSSLQSVRKQAHTILHNISILRQIKK